MLAQPQKHLDCRRTTCFRLMNTRQKLNTKETIILINVNLLAHFHSLNCWYIKDVKCFHTCLETKSSCLKFEVI